jgi:DNA-binding beta-propeller fold protein YncE
VKIFTPEGKYLGEFGRRGDNEGEFHFPLTVKVSHDTVFVVDSFHFAVQAFDLDGNYLYSFGPTPVGMGAMARPRDIAIDSYGHLYITDAVRNNVQIYSKTGQLLLRFGEVGIQPGQFQLPAGICIDKQNYIYIADSVNKRIQVFRYLGEEKSSEDG